MLVRPAVTATALIELGWLSTPARSATRLVSLHDLDARPIANGRINRPIEFWYKAQIVDNEDGIVVDYTVEQGNPADAPQLAPAIARIKVKWRSGSEGRISHLRHRYGWARTRIDGLAGARTWCGHGILAHNLVKITTLATG